MCILFATSMDARYKTVYFKAMLGPVTDLLTGLVTAVLMALFMHRVLDRAQSWFTHEQLPLIVFGLPVITGESGGNGNARV